MASSRVVLNHFAVRAFLLSPPVTARLVEAANQVKAAAESAGVEVQRGAEREPMPYRVQVDPSSSRARVYVIADHPAGLAAEAKYGTLTSALDAAG